MWNQFVSGTTLVIAPVIYNLAADFRLLPVSHMVSKLPLSRLILAPVWSMVDPRLGCRVGLKSV